MNMIEPFKIAIALGLFFLWGGMAPSCSLHPSRQRVPQQNTSGQPDILYHEALVLIEAGEYAEAQIKLEQVVASGNASPSVYNEFGVCAMQTGDHSLSRWSFEQAMELEPEAVEPHFNLGLLYERLGKLDLAMGLYQEAYQRSDANILILGKLAKVQFKLGARDKNVLGKLREIEKEHPDHRWADWARDAQVQCLSGM